MDPGKASEAPLQEERSDGQTSQRESCQPLNQMEVNAVQNRGASGANKERKADDAFVQVL